MTIAIVHSFVSLKSDGIDITKVQPSNWNDTHEIELAAGKIIGRQTGSAGPAQELGLAFTGGDADFDVGTGYLKIPRGTTAQRPGTPAAAMIRYNTDLGGFEKYNTGTAVWDLLATVTELEAGLTALLPTGLVAPYIGTTAPTGWVLFSNRTIGSAASGATERADADCATLFARHWDMFDNTRLPIQDSAGAPSTRGANAAADFAANKRLPLLDARGRLIAGLDNMGGSAAGRLTATTMTPDGNTAGATGGAQTGTFAINFTSGTNSGGVSTANGGQSTAPSPHTHDVIGNTDAGSLLQPTIILPYIIKL